MKTLLSALLLLVALEARGLHAAEPPDQDDCALFANVPIPTQDIGNAPAHCDADAMYYGKDGTGVGADYEMVRACAYEQRAHPVKTHYAMIRTFAGSRILAMLYANGLGVARNLPLAKHFACEDYEDARIEGRTWLMGIDQASPTTRFDICDEAQGTGMMIDCSAHSEVFAFVKRQRRMDALSRTWTVGQKQTFVALRKASQAFFDASSHGETDPTGRMYGVYLFDIRERLEDGFLEAIERFEHGGKPESGPYPPADASLNEAFRDLLQKIKSFEEENGSGSVVTTVADERAIQHQWLAYREAWVVFGASRYPQVPADAWRAWLTHERTQMLKDWPQK